MITSSSVRRPAFVGPAIAAALRRTAPFLASVALTPAVLAQPRPPSQEDPEAEAPTSLPRRTPPAADAMSARATNEEVGPSKAALGAAPPANRASGHLRQHDRDESALRSIARAILWTPRQLLEIGLWVPDRIFARFDDYLESRGPNVYNRGSEVGGWSGGAMLAWEAPFGPSVGARVGYSFGGRMGADFTALALGRHGYTGRFGWSFEPRTDGPVRIEVGTEYGHDREVAFAGIGDHSIGAAAGGADVDPFGAGSVPETILDDRALSVRLGVPFELGDLRLRPSGGFEWHDIAPDDEDSFAYDRAALIGFEEPFRLGHARLDATWDARVVPHPWIPRSAPATGWRARASIGYVFGSSQEDGDFRFGRYFASAERLFDVFRGTRVIIVSVRIEGITADSREVPFLLLPSLGGPDGLRAFSRGRFRDESATAAELSYEWAVGLNARAALFVEAGGVHDGIDSIDAEPIHVSAGVSLRFVYDGGTGTRAVIAGSDTGEMSFLIVVGGV